MEPTRTHPALIAAAFGVFFFGLVGVAALTGVLPQAASAPEASPAPAPRSVPEAQPEPPPPVMPVMKKAAPGGIRIVT